jgi:hypothetical protein
MAADASTPFIGKLKSAGSNRGGFAQMMVYQIQQPTTLNCSSALNRLTNLRERGHGRQRQVLS